MRAADPWTLAFAGPCRGIAVASHFIRFRDRKLTYSMGMPSSVARTLSAGPLALESGGSKWPLVIPDFVDFSGL
jgi:hypothetical protein